MNKIEVKIIHESSDSPAGMMMFLARLTQRGHKVSNMKELVDLYEESQLKHKSAAAIAALPHGTIKRFTPITIAIVGASRRFLAQARTNQVGINYVSASLQYSDYSTQSQFVVPYELVEADASAAAEASCYAAEGKQSLDENFKSHERVSKYLDSCEEAMNVYAELARDAGNDAAGYAAPQGLRNVLVMQGNHESWSYFIRTRSCSRNTTETQYVALRIWEELLKSTDGDDMFKYAGPDCMFGQCREGKMSCGTKLYDVKAADYVLHNGCSAPKAIMATRWPLLRRSDYGSK